MQRWSNKLCGDGRYNGGWFDVVIDTCDERSWWLREGAATVARTGQQKHRPNTATHHPGQVLRWTITRWPFQSSPRLPQRDRQGIRGLGGPQVVRAVHRSQEETEKNAGNAEGEREAQAREKNKHCCLDSRAAHRRQRAQRSAHAQIHIQKLCHQLRRGRQGQQHNHLCAGSPQIT